MLQGCQFALYKSTNLKLVIFYSMETKITEVYAVIA